MIVMVPPDCFVNEALDRIMRENGFSGYVEIEERAGCRCFRMKGKKI